MRNHRIFIAINLPAHLKKKLVKMQQEWFDMPVRLTKEASLHITLVFIGHVSNEEMLDICKLVRQVGEKHEGFEISLKKIILGPPGKAPRMIWAEGEKSLNLAKLRDDLEGALLDSEGSFRIKDTRAFAPHITLARIKQGEWKELKKTPEIENEIDLTFSVNSIEVMESQLLRSGAEYSVLETIELGK